MQKAYTLVNHPSITHLTFAGQKIMREAYLFSYNYVMFGFGLLVVLLLCTNLWVHQILSDRNKIKIT
jgi:hypothetical protein